MGAVSSGRDKDASRFAPLGRFTLGTNRCHVSIRNMLSIDYTEQCFAQCLYIVMLVTSLSLLNCSLRDESPNHVCYVLASRRDYLKDGLYKA